MKEQLLTFNKGAHGFKLSPIYRDRIYFYPTHQYDMDMKKIEPGNWIVKRVYGTLKNTIVILTNNP